MGYVTVCLTVLFLVVAGCRSLMVIQGHTTDLNPSDLVELGPEKEQKLPSGSTTRRTLQSLDSDDLNVRLVLRMYRHTGTIERRTVIAVDGKIMRGVSTDRSAALKHAAGAILVRWQMADRPIEIPALSELLKSSAPDGVVVIADVLRSQVDTDGGLVDKKLRRRLRDLQMRRTVVRRQLECTDEQLRHEVDTVLTYLNLLADPGRPYKLASPVVKCKSLTAFYAQI